MSLYDKTLGEVMAMDRQGIFLGLESTRKALAVLGEPHKKFPSVLVAGTNGKGSSVAMLSSILKQAGYRVGTTTSPHLMDLRERIQLNHKNISKSDFVRLTRSIRKKLRAKKIEVSFFEFLTVMAFVYFAQKKVDIAVVEVGLGGRLDATNVLNPLVSLISAIGLEHQRFLGNTLTKIANEKAGIIKPSGQVVTTVSQEKLRKQLAHICRERNAKCHALGQDFFIEKNKTGVHFKNKSVAIDCLKISLKGAFQVQNASGVLETICLLNQRNWNISERTIRQGLLKAVWPGRLELASRNPAILLDSAHNIQSFQAMMKSLRSEYEYSRLYMVLGVMADKNYRKMLKLADRYSDEIYFVSPPVKRALSVETLFKNMPELRRKIILKGKMDDVLPAVIKRSKKNELICVTGSIFTVSEAKRVLAS